VFDRFAARLSYVQGDFGDAATHDSVGAAIKAATRPVFYLRIPPSLSSTGMKGLADAGLTESGRVARDHQQISWTPVRRPPGWEATAR
jgi:glucose-6-phosphate 1-dehydrogenase